MCYTKGKELITGKIDTETKKYLDNDVQFSDMFNFWIYGGEDVIKPDKLRELDTTAIAIPYGNNAKKHVQRYRDLLKLYSVKQDDEAIYLILGVEIKAKTHYAMPVRNMLYDALNYAQQVSDIAEQSLNVTVNRAIEILCIPADEQNKYISLL